MSKTEICSHQNAPTLDLTLKIKKRWSDVVDYLSKKWGDVKNLQNRLQIFFVQANCDHGIDCLADPSVAVGRSLGTHPALLASSSSSIPVIELYYHLRPAAPLVSDPSSSSPRPMPRPQAFPSTDPTLQASYEAAYHSAIPPSRPTLLSRDSGSRPLQANEVTPPQTRNGKRALSPDCAAQLKAKPRLDTASASSLAPPSLRINNPQMKFQSGPLEILNLPLFLNQSSPSSFPPPPLPTQRPPTDWSDGVQRIGNDFNGCDLRQDSNLQLAFIRDGLQAIADSPLSSLPPLDGTMDAPGSASQQTSGLHSDHLEISPQFSSDTIAHFLDVMQEGEDQGPDTVSMQPPLTLEGFAEKVSRTVPSACGSDSELSNYQATSRSVPLSLPPQVTRTSPDPSSQVSLIESETIQDSEGDSQQRPHQQPQLANSSRAASSSGGEGGSQAASHLSVGIPQEIMKRSQRKPHLRRINPTLIGPLAGPSSRLWG
jgi:hypothetical protein